MSSFDQTARQQLRPNSQIARVIFVSSFDQTARASFVCCFLAALIKYLPPVFLSAVLKSRVLLFFHSAGLTMLQLVCKARVLWRFASKCHADGLTYRERAASKRHSSKCETGRGYRVATVQELSVRVCESL